jgi:Arc/MetJ-type ribon-helix-helix transcriptional regulator
MRNYRSVSIHEELVKRIKRLISRLGTYRTVTEFITEAVRLRIEALEKHVKSETTENEQTKV